MIQNSIFKNLFAPSLFNNFSTAKYKLVMLRHGESVWNVENRFTGWHDVVLSENGQQEAKNAGKILKEKGKSLNLKKGYKFDQVYTSVLQRAIMTYNLAANEMQSNHLPVEKSWRLNERHYGALQGLNKSQTAEKHGEQQVKLWRRSYATPPPALELNDERHPSFDSRYKYVPKNTLPATECLKDCVERVLPFWFDRIAPSILRGDNVLIVAHGNSLRSLLKYLDNISEKDIMELNVPTGVPLVYELDADLKPVKNYYLIDEAELKAKQNAVANQGKKH